MINENEKTQLINSYETWKSSINNNHISAFIDFCITRIDSEPDTLRIEFIKRLILIDALKIPQLFEAMLGINCGETSHDLELPERKISDAQNPLLRNEEKGESEDTSSNNTVESVENILQKKAPHLQQKDLPAANCAPISPAMKQFTKFQEWISSKKEEDIIKFNQWLSTISDVEQNITFSQAIKVSFTLETIKTNKLKRAEQRKFLDWYANEIRKIIDFFAIQKFLPIIHSNPSEKVETYENLLKTWRERFTQSVVEIKHSFQDNETIENLLSGKITQLVDLVNRDLAGFYAKLEQRAVEEHYFYHSNNFQLTPQHYYQQYLDQQNLELQQSAFEKDPNAERQKLVITTLRAKPSDSSYTLFSRTRQRFTPETNLIQPLTNATTLEKLLHERVDNEGKQVPLYTLLSDEQKELLKICLTHNPAELNNFINKHGMINVIAWALPIVSYMGECVYFVADFILRADSFKPIFDAFDLGFLLKEKYAFLALNLLVTVFVIVANVTFDPRSEANKLLQAWFLNPKGSHGNVFAQLKGFFDTHIIDVATKNKLLTLCFAGMAFSGAAIETIAIALLKPYLSAKGYEAMYGAGSAFLITSGVLYYFFMNFQDIINATPDAIEAFKAAASKIWCKDENGNYTFNSAAFIEFQQMLVAIVERTFRLSYGPFAFMKGMGQSELPSYIAGIFGGLTTFGTTFATRVEQVAAAYHLKDKKENLPKARTYFYDEATMLQRAYMRQGDPFTIPAVGMSYILARVTAASMDSTQGALLGTGVFFVALAVMLKISQSSADVKIINRLASQEKTEATWALSFSQVCCGGDQFSRAVGLITILVALGPKIFNTQTESNKLCIQAALILAIYLSYAAFTYQSSKTNSICQNISDWIQRKAGQYGAKSLGNSNIFATNGGQELSIIGRDSQHYLELSETDAPSKRLDEFVKARR